MKTIKPFATAVCVALLGGCASMSNPVSSLTGEAPHPEAQASAIDTGGALTTLQSIGFVESDFGSPEAMRSAAVMLSALGEEWQAFNAWTEEFFERQAELKGKIRNPECFGEAGNILTYSRYADEEVKRRVTYASTPDLQKGEWQRAELEAGKKMDLDDFVEWQIARENDDVLEQHRQRALREYGSKCTIGTPTNHAHYVLNVHFADVKGSLFAAAIDRVGAHRALEMTTKAMQQQVGSMNEVTKALWKLSNDGEWRTPIAPLPAFVGRSEGILPWHLGGMCSPFGSGSRNNEPVPVDEIAVALGFEPRPTDGGWHCLTWSDYNWDKVAEFVASESKLLRRYMEEYSPVSNGYAVPSWAYPGPNQKDQQFYTRRRDLKRDSGMSSRSTVHERETCNTYAAKHSNLMTWLYPACSTLEELSDTFDERAELMRAAGRADAFTCSRDLTASSYAPDVSKCPSVFPRSSMESGIHKVTSF